MQVEIFSGEILIGRSNLDQLDPPMGVAMGAFVPTEAYDRIRHANSIEGEFIAYNGLTLIVRSSEYGEIVHQGVHIEDYSDNLAEIQISVIGIPYPEYESYFSEYDHYRKYNDLD
ncbi:MAG: hypothetical protein ABJO01_07065 [Parasphingorhabdus sp.]|uniref:hypothetical protein n=1 Tax=Parasphingorhabdus sp. TaxID=2709688 RepID=UPI0032997527